MRKIIASIFITLDGVAEAPGSGDTSLPELCGWSEPFMTPEMGELIMSQMDANDGLLLGRVTYQGFAAFWPNVPETDPFGYRMNNLNKYVVSTTLKSADWKNSRLVQGDFVTEITKIKQQAGGNLAVTGSLGLTRSLIQHDLLDELQLAVCPVILGAGKRLFAEGHPKKVMKLVDSRTFSSGMMLLTYHPATSA